MRTAILVLILAATASPLAAQPRIELVYGFDRNVESSEPEHDGWVGANVEWTIRQGWSLGIGTDHQFEGARPSISDHQSLAIFGSLTRSFAIGGVSPYARVGVGMGRAPCESDTCGEGLYIRAAAGLRARLAGPLEVMGEVGLTRVGRPLAGVGLSYRR